MHRGPGDLYAPGQGGFVNVEAIVALAPEGGKQGGVHVQDAAGIVPHEILGQDAHEPRQNDELHAVFFQQPQDFLLKGFLGAALPLGHMAGNVRVFRPFQGVGVGAGCNNGHELHMGQPARRFRIDQGLQIGAAAGHQHGGARRTHAITTPSSPLTISPST